jgi:hypothetical protein
MKKTSTITLLALSLSVLPLNLLKAETPQPPAPKQPASESAKREKLEKMKSHAEQMDKALGLSPAQQTKMTETRKQNLAAMQALRQNKSLSKEARKAERQALRKSSDEKINALLTPAQKAKREEMKKAHKEKIKNKS